MDKTLFKGLRKLILKILISFIKSIIGWRKNKIKMLVRRFKLINKINNNKIILKDILSSLIMTTLFNKSSQGVLFLI